MPSFPNISTLTEVTPVGTEVIQISATQKTTLSKIAGLAAGILTNGASYPFAGNGYYGIVGYAGTTVFGIRVNENFLNRIEFSKATVSASLTSNTPASELLSYLTSWESLTSLDYFQAIGDEFYVDPGKQVFVTSLPGERSILFNENAWDPEISGKIFSASILSPYNITKSMISVGSFETYTVQTVFSENFDDDPGGTYQIVAVQLYYNANSPKTIVLAFNKAPYSA